MKKNVTIVKKIFNFSLKFNQTLIFTTKSFFYTKLGFTWSHSYPLDDLDGSYHLIPGSNKNERPITITEIDKIHLKCDCTDGSIVNVVREPIFYSFALDQSSDHKICKQPRKKIFNSVNKPVLSHITFYLEDDDHKAVDFNGEMINFICQLIKI